VAPDVRDSVYHRDEDKKLQALAWLEVYAKETGDKMPCTMSGGRSMPGEADGKKRKGRTNKHKEVHNKPKRARLDDDCTCDTCVDPELNCQACGCACEGSREKNARREKFVVYILAEGSKTEVWNKYCCYMRAYHYTEEAPVSLSLFLKVWREEMPWIKVGRKRSRFAECQDCAVLKRIIQNGSERARIRARELLAKHRELQAQQRQKYYKHREKAIQNQMKYLSIIMDAMDQKKTELPQVLRKSKKHDQTQGAGLKQKVVALTMLSAVSFL
jgi:hypothetical protein